jgi:hypothetical protein
MEAAAVQSLAIFSYLLLLNHRLPVYALKVETSSECKGGSDHLNILTED